MFRCVLRPTPPDGHASSIYLLACAREIRAIVHHISPYVFSLVVGPTSHKHSCPSVSRYSVDSLINIMLLVLDEAEHSVQVTPYSADSNRNSCNIWLQAQ